MSKQFVFVSSMFTDLIAKGIFGAYKHGWISLSVTYTKNIGDACVITDDNRHFEICLYGENTAQIVGCLAHELGHIEDILCGTLVPQVCLRNEEYATKVAHKLLDKISFSKEKREEADALLEEGYQYYIGIGVR